MASADVFARVAEFIAAHPGLPPIDHANVLVRLAPPRVDLWVLDADHVTPWAQALGTRVEVTTTLEDHPKPSHVITSTLRTTVNGVSFRVVHLRYLTDAPRS
jgi:hypothetical protein